MSPLPAPKFPSRGFCTCPPPPPALPALRLLFIWANNFFFCAMIQFFFYVCVVFRGPELETIARGWHPAPGGIAPMEVTSPSPRWGQTLSLPWPQQGVVATWGPPPACCGTTLGAELGRFI